jgi:lincosamide nucleotidyltransferase A/C/D/E
MRSSEVRNLCEELDRLEIPIWVDGGWAVDALLGKQTRPHDDLDIVIEHRHLSRLCQHLRDNGYTDVPRDDTRAWNFVLGDNEGRQIDIHVISFFDEAGNGIYGPIENGETYPAGSLTGKGIVDGYTVNCISPDQLVKFHTGYKPREKDYKDVFALCERFDIERPIEYQPDLRPPHSRNLPFCQRLYFAVCPAMARGRGTYHQEQFEFHWTVADYITAMLVAGCQLIHVEEFGDTCEDWEGTPMTGLPRSLLLVGRRTQ